MIHALYFSTLITFCGVVQPPDILSSSSVVRISFRSTLRLDTEEFIIDYKHACWRKSGVSLNCTGTDTAGE